MKIPKIDSNFWGQNTFRVTLRRIYSIIKIPKFEAFQSHATEQQSSTDFEEVVSVKWQQKIFSKTEKLYYAQKENCKTELEKRYHQIIKESSGDEANNESGLVFSYIDEDKYQPPDNFGSGDVRITKLRRNVESNEPSKDESLSGLFVAPQDNVAPIRYGIGNDFIKMFIMADLEPTTVLVSIYYRQSDGAFIIFPDFNGSDNEYLVEIDQNSKQLFGYFIENLSLGLTDAMKQQSEKEKLSKIQEETCELMRKLNISKDPDFICPKFCRIVLLLEIIDGTDFEFNNLHVRFQIKLPRFVKVVEGDLEGATHSSTKNENLWRFGYCHCLVLDIDDEFSLSTSKVDSMEIDFEIISIDSSWERERREGISTSKMPLLENSSKILELTCYRDLQGGSWLTDCLERFFLGGIHRKESLNQKFEGIQNLYGNKTVSTGTLRLKIQKVIQTRASKRNYSKMKSVDEIISSYHKAKARLQK